MKFTTILPCIFLASVMFSCNGPVTMDTNAGKYERWTEDEINAWYQDLEWQVGFNYVPSTKVNQIDMWQEESFDPVIIDKELAMGAELGFNTVRIFLHDLVYQQDPEGFKDRFTQCLDIADKYGMMVVPTFFTNGGKQELRKLGKQPDEIPGTHNILWIKTPGQIIANDTSKYAPLEVYVKDFITSFAQDDRILCWYLYNEPWNNSFYLDKDVPHKIDPLNLLKAVFKWARACGPSQPLTACMYMRGDCPTNDFLIENADIITFHCYKDKETMEKWIARLKEYNRPIMCGEYMGRPVSTFREQMPVLKENKIIALNFGLTAGKPGFYNQWNSPPSDVMPEIWFHDILTANGEPHDAGEVEFIKQMMSDKNIW